MIFWDSCFYPLGNLFSPMANLEGPNALPKGLIDALILFTPYLSNLKHSTLLSPYPSIPPHFTASCPPFPTNIHHAHLPEGSPNFKCCPASLHPPATWLQHCSHLPSVPASFNAHLPWVYCSFLSHAPGLIAPSIMSSPRIYPHPHFSLGHDSVCYVISLEKILLDVIAEVNEGWL